MQVTQSPQASPHFDHLLKVGVLHKMAHNPLMPQPVRDEAAAELARYRAEGEELLRQRQEARYMPKKKSKKEPEADYLNPPNRVFAGRGVLFAVADDREDMGDNSTVDVIAAAIDEALEAGHDDPDSIARYILTSSFNHEPDKRVRYNSLLRAGDAVGAQMTRKLYNAYNDLAEMAATAETEADKKLAKVEASGFAAAVSIVFSPFSCEDPDDPRLVDWDEVDHITQLFETEQRAVRRERKGRPQ